MSTIKIAKDFIKIEATLSGISNVSQFKFRGAKVLNLKTKAGDTLKGVVINISNENPGSPCMSAGLESGTFDFMFKNDLGWNKNDKVRISFLNEIDYRDFERLMPYFESRLRKFGYDELVTIENFLNFSDEWSKFHEDNPVDDICKHELSPIPRQTHDGGVVRIEELP
ncbi:hypothetical protein [Chryseobacterium polytrichastri]|uniref:Uncharacterized protein n=1 Tax=Chryseobacterium polytrichastri TaxID=1302687 RepID=A0A1M6Q8K7_9FLAO|nr:hypothetical protein [Chryseobacterium polytrichastri]SHK16480.1 hypothetical protein SAMN05444267_1001247 [Chryseobacterium polytrichastri]